MTFPRSLLVFLAAGCAHAQSGSEVPSSARTTPPPVSPITPSARAGTASSATPTSPVVVDAGPPPLRSGSPGGASPFSAPDAREKPSDCSEAQVIARLREVTDRCRDKAGSVCGKITVASDPTDNRVGATFDLATGGAVGAFSDCVSRELTSVNWGCVVGSEPVKLDLGCDL